MVILKYLTFHVHRKDSYLLTALIFNVIIYLQLFDNSVITSTHVFPAAVRVCVTVLGVWGRQVKIQPLPATFV